ncbi:hypothetical protein [Streptomyces longwoodensis]|uniref:hypothetical protein n=1 Tax=Streptomyces longwoodensis TaxID=68231 RepID=UPI0036F644CC
MQMLQMAEMLSEAELFVPTHLHGKPADILALMFRAKGMDIPLAVAWDELYATSDGDVGRRAKLVRALARRAGHRIDFVERDRFHAVALVRTADGEQHEVSFTIQEAVERGYTDPSYPFADSWTRMPEDMLVARVTTRAVNWFCPEVLLGLGADLAEHADDPQNASQVVEIREERRAQVAQVLRLMSLSERQPNGMVRLSLLRGLFMDCRDALLLDYDTDGTGQASVRHVLTDAMRAADVLAKAQSSGEAPTADPADGPQTLDDLRGLDEAPAPPDAAPEPEAEAEAAPEPEAEAEPVKKPRKRAAKKTAAKDASSPQGGTGATAAPKGSARGRKAASRKPASPAPGAPGRPAARSAARPDDFRAPCGCLVDEIIRTGKHADGCADAQGGTP